MAAITFLFLQRHPETGSNLGSVSECLTKSQGSSAGFHHSYSTGCCWQTQSHLHRVDIGFISNELSAGWRYLVGSAAGGLTFQMTSLDPSGKKAVKLSSHLPSMRGKLCTWPFFSIAPSTCKKSRMFEQIQTINERRCRTIESDNGSLLYGQRW